MGLGKKKILSQGSSAFVAADNFAPTLYTGNATARSISTGFAPDLVWIKARNFASSNALYNSVSTAPYYLSSNTSSAELNATTSLTSFDSNGFSLGDDSGLWGVNASGKTYVAWCWKGGGAASSNTNGTITSSVSANVAAGFSIVKWVGTYANATVGHGLSSAPELIIAKNLDTAGGSGTYDGWPVYASAIGNDQVVTLNSSAEKTSSSGTWGSTTPTSTVFTVQDNNDNNKSGDNIIAYCFTSITGYQKIGSYTGSSLEHSVNIGFAPRFIMIKKYDGSGSWRMYDSARDGTSVPRRVNHNLQANEASAEYDSTGDSAGYFHITSTGLLFYTGNTNPDVNSNGSNYLYLAIA